MDVLLDTHILLWWDQDAPELGEAARQIIANRDNRVFVSAASPWEIAIKARKGKLRFAGSPCDLVEAYGFLPLSISPRHAEGAGTLDWEHTDPFDRVLVVQAQQESLVLIHADATIRTFGAVTQMWGRA